SPTTVASREIRGGGRGLNRRRPAPPELSRPPSGRKRAELGRPCPGPAGARNLARPPEVQAVPAGVPESPLEPGHPARWYASLLPGTAPRDDSERVAARIGPAPRGPGAPEPEAGDDEAWDDRCNCGGRSAGRVQRGRRPGRRERR